MRTPRKYEGLTKCSGLLNLGSVALGAVLIFAAPSLADDANKPADKYLSLPNLTSEQKARIEAIESMADAQIQAVLTADQKAALASGGTQAGGAQATAAAAGQAPLGGGKGLYGDDATGLTNGPVADRDYWQAKFNAEQLEDAIKTRQPEGAIALHLISDISLLDGFLKKYPNHQEAKAWRDRAVAVQKKIGENFDRGASFNKGCLYNEDSYMQAYVCYNVARMDIDKKDYNDARGFLQISHQKFDWLTEDASHMDGYPDAAKKWVQDTKPLNDKLIEEVHAHG